MVREWGRLYARHHRPRHQASHHPDDQSAALALRQVVSRLCGEREDVVSSWTEARDGRRSKTRSTRMVPVISVADVRSLPACHALLLHRGMKRIETQLTPWFRSRIATEIAAGTATTAAL